MPRIRGIAILDYPPLAGSIPTPSPWFTVVTQSITLTSGSAVLPTTATSQLNIGQPASGTGIQNNSYIVSIIAGTSVTLNLPATASGSNSITFGLANPSQSPNPAVGSPWNGPPLPPLLNQSGAFVDVNGCLLEVPNSQVIPAAGTYVLPPGEGLMLLTSGTTAAQFQVFQGTTSPAWTTIASGTSSASVLLPFMSDGANFRINSPTTSTTVVLYQWR
jgi:hypothetical protein